MDTSIIHCLLCQQRYCGLINIRFNPIAVANLKKLLKNSNEKLPATGVRKIENIETKINSYQVLILYSSHVLESACVLEMLSVCWICSDDESCDSSAFASAFARNLVDPINQTLLR